MKQQQQKRVLSFWEDLLFFFFPPKCALCGKVGFFGLCEPCGERLWKAYAPKHFLASGGNGHADGMLALFPYENKAVRRLLFDFKSHPYADLTEIFRPFLERAARDKAFPKEIDAVTYLPRRKGTKRLMGFDQAEILANLLGEVLGLPVKPLMHRGAPSRSQHSLPFEKREANVRDAFLPCESLQGETVLLVDDIVTSGASARAGARVLKRMGAMKVYLFALAH